MLTVTLYLIVTFYCLQWSTPLYVASEKGHCDVVEALAKAGADVNVISKIVSHDQLLGV